MTVDMKTEGKKKNSQSLPKTRPTTIGKKKKEHKRQKIRQARVCAGAGLSPGTQNHHAGERLEKKKATSKTRKAVAKGLATLKKKRTRTCER